MVVLVCIGSLIGVMALLARLFLGRATLTSLVVCALVFAASLSILVGVFVCVVNID